MTSLDNFQVSRNAAERYKQFVYPIMAPWIDEMLASAKLKAGERVLDLACGPGFAALEATKIVGSGGKVVGLDLNPGMIDVARQSAEKQGKSQIQWQQGNAAELPFDDNSFDVVLCQQGVQFFPNIVNTFREIHRVLVFKGRFICTVWGSIEGNPYFVTMANVLGRTLGPQLEAGVHNAFEKSYSNLYEKALREAGFAETFQSTMTKTVSYPALETYVPGHYSALPFADTIANLPEEMRQALFNEIILTLRPYETDDGAEIPASGQIITAFCAASN